MGFNNWNTTGCAVDEQIIRDTADIFVAQGLNAAGYQYVNVDDCWAEPARDADGRIQANRACRARSLPPGSRSRSRCPRPTRPASRCSTRA
jgi:hypothetical protein